MVGYRFLCAALPAILWAGAALAAPNPFAVPSSLPYQAPRFDQIKDGDYQPAFDTGMKQQMAEIDAIAANPAAPSFENTIAALERSGRMLERVNNTFFAVVQANTNPALDKVQTIEAPKLAAISDASQLLDLTLNPIVVEPPPLVVVPPAPASDVGAVPSISAEVSPERSRNGSIARMTSIVRGASGSQRALKCTSPPRIDSSLIAGGYGARGPPDHLHARAGRDHGTARGRAGDPEGALPGRGL